MTGDPFFTRLLTALTAPGAGYARSSAPTATTVLDLGVGEARYPMPPALCQQIGEVAAQTDRLWYSDPRGEIELRQAYLDHLQPHGDAEPSTVLVTAGGKEAALLALRYLLHAGGGGPVLIPSPGWEPYRFWATAAGARVLGYDPIAVAQNPNRLRQLIAAAVPRPRVLILNYPHNPTGVGVEQSKMDEIIAVATGFGIGVVSDEVYRMFGETSVSAAHAPAYDPARHIVVDSVSKSLAVAGLRVGFLHAYTPIVDALTAFRGAYASCTSVLAQRVATSLLISPTAQAWLADVREQLAASRTATAAALTDAGIEVVSHGGLYLWCRPPDPSVLPAPGMGAPVTARVTPGVGFGAADHFRVCTARADLVPRVAAAAVVETMRGR
ncbi:pyridoxal phosphate-dependent aminotransferase [Nocardia salmonicida]|uniref:pyridoxal phosphate-dependent aminotransferase n=1 Tax=Nocardia salmonicida TaxID=53431 RepID=UPI003796B379